MRRDWYNRLCEQVHSELKKKAAIELFLQIEGVDVGEAIPPRLWGIVFFSVLIIATRFIFGLSFFSANGDLCLEMIIAIILAYIATRSFVRFLRRRIYTPRAHKKLLVIAQDVEANSKHDLIKILAQTQAWTLHYAHFRCPEKFNVN